jgi:hypothetical protein
MDTDLSRVTVTRRGNMTTACVFHRDFPEIRAEGATPKEAATFLVNKLACTLDSALTDWRRERVDQAIADVKEFVSQEEDDLP